MSTSPQVSVIIGFRDWGVERLRLAVRSHRRSTLPENLEVIVVDYGSRDAAGVRRAVEEEGARLARVEAAGRPWSRARVLNYGIRQAARASLILTTDSDILFSPRTAETVLAAITKASGREGTYALVQCRDLPPSYPEERLQEFDWASMEATSTLRPRYGMGGCACFPRSFVEPVRGYDERMEWWGAEDADLARRAEAAGLELCWVEHPDARIYHLWHEKILETHRDDQEFQKTSARNRSYLTGSRTLYRNLDEWGGLPSPAVSVSIVIVIRDRADALARAIDSVLGQTYQNFELMVIDGGSKGENRAVVDSFADPRVRYLRQPFSGIPQLRDLGVRMARGTHLCFLDDGDRMLPNGIEDHLYAMAPGSAGSYGGSIELNGKAKELRYHRGKEHRSGKEARGKTSKATGLERRMGLVGDLLSRPTHLVFLALIAALGSIVCAAWLLEIIDATGFVIGMTVLGAGYALGLLMLWLESSLGNEVTQAELMLANRIESKERHIVHALNDQITGVRAQEAEDTRRAAAQSAQLASLIHATQMIRRLELRGLPPEDSGRASEDFLYLIVPCISVSRPRTIIELGSGPSTVIVAAFLSRLGSDAQFYSIEHDRHRLEETRRMLRENTLENRVEIVLAPIRDTKFGPFYDLEAFASGLERVDMLLVGGPPLYLGPRIRRTAMDYFHPLLSDSAMVLFDEGHRESERENARRWKIDHPELSLQFVDNRRGCFILRKPCVVTEHFHAGSNYLAAPRFSLSTTKAIFIGGIISTGSTALKAALLGCDFATSTGKYAEGGHDPDCPPLWPEGTIDPAAPASEAFHAWVDGYCHGPWFIEKTSGRFVGFLAMQRRLGPEMSHFLMTQRDPYQAIAFIRRRCPERYGLGPGHPPGRILADDSRLIRRLEQAIDFHEKLRPELRNFSYVRYEELCTDPKGTLSVILRFLGVAIAAGALKHAAALVKRDIHHYPITVEAEKTRAVANRLCRLWDYPEM